MGRNLIAVAVALFHCSQEEIFIASPFSPEISGGKGSLCVDFALSLPLPFNLEKPVFITVTILVTADCSTRGT